MPRIALTTENFDDVFKQARAHLNYYLEKKGSLSLTSTHECSGFISEEFSELQDAVHENSHDEFELECLDLVTAAILSIASRQAGGLDW